MTTTPANNIEGAQVWNPSVGIYFKPASGQRESYGGVVGALQDNIQIQGGESKAYPHNFAGIIAAIQDLTFTQEPAPPSPPGVKPPDGEVIIDGEGNPEWIWITEPKDGDLWFDTRQGRMFIAIDGEYYQTNGADGLAQVTDGQQPQEPVIGQFWWDISTNSLYIFDGFWLDPDGEIKGVHQPGYTPVWRLIESADGVTQTSFTLPLGDPLREQTGLILPDAQAGTMNVQSDYNTWLFNSLEALEKAIQSGEYSSVQIEMGTTPPASPSAGDLWYDTVSLDLNIWYEDNNTGQWIPTAVYSSYDTEITALSTKLLIEENARRQEYANLQSEVNLIKERDINELRLIESRIQNLQSDINAHAVVDFTGYVTDSQLSEVVVGLTSSIDAVKEIVPATGSYATPQDVLALTSTVQTLPTIEDVDAAIAEALPNVSTYVTQLDIDGSINNITREYLPRNGGVIDGSFVVEKSDVTQPSFDFSTNKWNGRNSHKYLTHSYEGESNYVTFGTNDRPWQYAWTFNADEDFCWMYNDTNKVFSITKDGPACSQLYIGDLQTDNINGRQIFNKIDVKDRLIKHQNALLAIRQGVADATDFDELKTNILLALNSI